MKMISILGIDFFRVENFLTYEGKRINYNNMPIPDNEYNKILLRQFLKCNTSYTKHVIPNLIEIGRIFKHIHKMFHSYYIYEHTEKDKFNIEYYNKGLNEIISFYYRNHLQYFQYYQIKKELTVLSKDSFMPEKEIFEQINNSLFYFIFDKNNWIFTDKIDSPHKMTDNEYMEYKQKQYIACKEYYLAKRRALEKKIIQFIEGLTWFKEYADKDKIKYFKIQIFLMLKRLR